MKFCCIATINNFNKVAKEDVDNSSPDATLLSLKFEVTLKAEQKELKDLQLTFNGMRDENTLTITSYQLQSMQSNSGMIHKSIHL